MLDNQLFRGEFKCDQRHALMNSSASSVVPFQLIVYLAAAHISKPLSMPFLSPTLAAGRNTRVPVHTIRHGASQLVGKAPSSNEKGSTVHQGGERPKSIHPVFRVLWHAPLSHGGVVQNKGIMSWLLFVCGGSRYGSSSV